MQRVCEGAVEKPYTLCIQHNILHALPSADMTWVSVERETGAIFSQIGSGHGGGIWRQSGSEIFLQPVSQLGSPHVLGLPGGLILGIGFIAHVLPFGEVPSLTQVPCIG
jgi:hypothetical protein